MTKGGALSKTRVMPRQTTRRKCLMTRNMHLALVVPGRAVAGATLFAAIVSDGPATAADPWPSTTAEMQQLIYSPWAKFCGKGGGSGAKEVCFTGKDARTEAGQPVVAVVLIETEGEPRRALRVTLPSSLQPQFGTRLVIDKEQPICSAFLTCFANGCLSGFEATPELVDKLKKGQMLHIQAINPAGTPVSFALLLADTSGNSFPRANEGSPTDPKVFEEQQKRASKPWRCDQLLIPACDNDLFRRLK